MPKDDLTAVFVEHMSLGKYGPDKRSAKNSFLYEISPEQMASYTPAQLAEILSQRDHVILTTAPPPSLASPELWLTSQLKRSTRHLPEIATVPALPVIKRGFPSPELTADSRSASAATGMAKTRPG